MNRKAGAKTIPPRFYASADQYLSSTNDFNKLSSNGRTTPEPPRPSSPHSRAKHTPDASRKQPQQAVGQRKYRQMPLTMSIEDPTPDDIPKSSWKETDDTGSDDSERLAQFEHESLVKVVARLRDGNYIGSQSSPQVVTTYSNSLPSQFSTPNFNHSLTHTNDLDLPNNSTTGNHGTPLNGDSNISPTFLMHNKAAFNNSFNSSSNFNSSIDKYSPINGNSPSSTDVNGFSTTPKATNVGETDVLEASRRQMEAEIAESKRLLQQQLDMQRRYVRTPPSVDREASSSPVPLPNGVETSNIALSPDANPEKNTRYLESQVVALTSQLNVLRESHAKAIAEMRDAHAHALVELRETHAQDQLALSRQVREERAERRRAEVKDEETRREAEQKLSMAVKEAGERERVLLERDKALAKKLEEMKAEFDGREDALRDLAKVQAEALRYQQEAAEAKGKLEELEFGRTRLAEERTRLEEERRRIDDEKRRVEDQRRQYEKAGTDVLKVLNDANQKIIALEEHKWKLEDQCAELRGINEREKKTAEQQRSKLEQELDWQKKETEKESSLRQQEFQRLQGEIGVRERERQGLVEEARKRNELLKEREKEVDLLRNKLVEAEQRMLKVATQNDALSTANAKDREEWRKEREDWDREKDALTGALVEARDEKNKLEIELDENRRKFENVKKLIG